MKFVKLFFIGLVVNFCIKKLFLCIGFGDSGAILPVSFEGWLEVLIRIILTAVVLFWIVSRKNI